MENKGRRILTDEELEQVAGGNGWVENGSLYPCDDLKTENECSKMMECQWDKGEHKCINGNVGALMI